MTESKYKSKGVPTLEITDELSKAVSDMGFITPILKSLMVSVIWLALIGAIYNGNWTEWSAIWVEIIRVIPKLNERRKGKLFRALLEQLEIVKKNFNSTWWLKENLSSIPQREPRNGRFCLVFISTIKNFVLLREIAFPRSAFTIICTIVENSNV